MCICVLGHVCVGEKMDADTMDEKRKEHMAYEYLCHLEEAKQSVDYICMRCSFYFT